MKMSFPEDILIEILARLPAKSLYKFKCVSKEWNNLISWGTSSRKILPPLMSGLFYQYMDQSGYASMPNSKVANGGDMGSLDFLPFCQKLRIDNSCNGLLLCSMKGSDWGQEPKFVHYIVCNPTTGKWVSLPKVHKIDNTIGLAYDPRISHQFKVVRFLHCVQDDLSIELEIFSSETGNWVESTVYFGFEGYFLSGTQVVYSNGALHVLFNPYHVLRFDIKEESCQLIELPEAMTSFLWTYSLGEFGGCLHYAEINRSKMKIWTLKDCRSSEWVLKNRIRIRGLVKQLPQPRCWRFDFLALHPDLEVVFLEMQGKIFSYHLKSSKLEEFWTITHMKTSDEFVVACPFSSCLDAFVH
ncbi:F-box protein At5g49610-like [Tasmannia lanceolata]|uniref:F-box protein At5g49610-like n=1 Tax=Tasmannia lanceolata TaxID=3420 RepID=UPI0040649BCB